MLPDLPSNATRSASIDSGDVAAAMSARACSVSDWISLMDHHSPLFRPARGTVRRIMRCRRQTPSSADGAIAAAIHLSVPTKGRGPVLPKRTWGKDLRPSPMREAFRESPRMARGLR
ncbi:hypothetical protein PAGU2595_005760 [Lysobacter xanthus]